MALGEFLPGNGIVALYHLENVNDSSSNGITLTNNNSVGFNQAKFSNGADFGSSNTNKSLTVANDLTIRGGSVTFSFWVKLNAEISSGIWGLLSQKDAGVFTGHFIDYQFNSGTRRLVFTREKQNVADDQIFYNIALGTSLFHHITMVYDLSTTTVSSFVDFTPVGTVASSGNGASGYTNDSFSLGCTIGGGETQAQFASCIIDECGVFNRPFSFANLKAYQAWSLGQRTSVA